VFGVILVIMALCIAGGIVAVPEYTIPEIRLSNLHPSNLPIWPFMFITVACGAVSGFHATQSPMMAKCITSEKAGRQVFYGAMIIEAVIALIWAAAGVAFYGSTQMLSSALSELGQSGVVYEISHEMLSSIGGILAVVGVVICPITSGDTAFRSARLILAEWTGLKQTKIKNRLILTIPMLAVAVILTQIDFDIMWRYFSLANQALAAISLWTATSYLIHKGKYRFGSLITALPAAFMSAVTMTYLLMADEGFRLALKVSYPSGIALAVFLLVIYGLQMLQWRLAGEEYRANWSQIERFRKLHG
jgi:carbon starvation protein CstA